MGKFQAYKIPLKSLSDGKHSFVFQLDEEYFKEIDSPEIKKGNVSVQAELNKTASTYALEFHLEGLVYIPCDRCLDDMEQEITYNGKLIVKFGNDYSQESDEIVVIPDSEGEINIAWFLFVFIILSIPVKHVHESGACNKLMVSKLKNHLILKIGDEEGDYDELDDEIKTEIKTDPRWDALRKLK